MEYWPQVKIGDVCIVERGGSPRPIDKYITDSEDGINWIKIGDTDDSMYITSTAQKIIPEGAKKSRYVQPGDFLLSNSMSFGRPYILKIDGCIHDGWLVLRDKNGLFDKRFLYYYLSAPVTYQKFKSLAVGGVVNNLNSEMVRNVEVPLPALNEQAQIATVLDKLSGLISLRKQQLAKLDELVKARFMEMFGDPIRNDKCLSTKELGSICLLKAGITTSTEEIRGYDEEYQIPCYGGNGIRGYVKTSTQRGIYPIIGRQGALCGNVQLAQGYFHATEHAVLVTPLIELNIFWLFYLLKFMDLYRYHTGAAQPGLAVKTLNTVNVPIASLDRQNEFAILVEKIDRQKLTIQQSLDKLEMLKKSLMQEYFG
jgi:type I restriction enzyme S subunit